eukprot:Gregarina_sp_Pseudo_9__5180@NODE_55_length_4759_cov_242_162500_g52_i0_p3_GENE_NODE_55_length_4759_cov_242_162500_g52_i0NODE_55_length_4759_cov_242_162500_g52_i0_p3_ORF_typecomplete_len326_score85_63NmrA/PF05368_13/4_5e28Epimerase/PF01370_21/7_5e24NAD_binding_10/PF13460_6/1_4e22RmlD_sub_bind/PF04321_17/4e133Beta_HSD/PF01073_19/1_3e11GDP_Man_Dehyd/PF16363_5/2_3e07adh_short/PF00106_25/6_2e06Sacchrp_dh_NADP/PF03435_18/0_00032TrkA_N/PF02254_18/0_0035KR/PF08659_10/0_0038Shikimate_DH/PF01488_20/0_029ad
MSEDETRTALVLGATGGVGSEIARALLEDGWKVKALTRRAQPPETTRTRGIEWIMGDAMNAFDVRHAAGNAEVIVHAVNPPGYRDWDKLVLPMIDNTIQAAADAGGARIVLPGTIYNYGRDAFPLIRETSPQHPLDHKGALRVELEQRIEKAVTDGKVQALILRCGDFFGPNPGNNWFSQGLVEPSKPLTCVKYPGPPELKHAWAYLPDVGDTVVALLRLEHKLQRFAPFHFPGHAVTGNEMLDCIRDVTGKSDLKLQPFPWTKIALFSPCMETLRELRKLRYLWEESIELDGSKLINFLEPEAVPHTDLKEAVKKTLEGLKVIQ